MVLQVGLLFLLTISVSVLAQSMLSTPFFQTLGLDAAWIREGWRQVIRTLSLFVPFFITTVMFFQLYYLVPQPHPRKRSALSGALIAAILWEAAKQAFTYYATYVGRFDRYGSGVEGLDALGNTFGLIIAFVFWVYFSGIVLMLGAVIASLREHRHVTAGRLPGDIPAAGDGEPSAEGVPSSAEAPAADPSSPERSPLPDPPSEEPPEDATRPPETEDDSLLSFPKVLGEDAPEKE